MSFVLLISFLLSSLLFFILFVSFFLLSLLWLFGRLQCITTQPFRAQYKSTCSDL
jgi:hypothetical protein